MSTRAPWPFFATTVDGIRVHMQSQQVQMTPDCVDQLTANPLRSSDMPYMREVLGAARLPQLTTLVVDYKEDLTDRQFPMFHLPSDSHRFPSLISIKMTNAWMLPSPALASHLRVLQLGCDVKGACLGIPMDLWRECLGSFSRVEKLSLIRCFALSVAPQAPASGRRPLDASRLQDLTIEDLPFSINQIMSELIVPTSATVNLRGIVGRASPELCGRAILAMLPHDRTRLPILHSCKGIEVAVSRDECSVTAYMQDGYSSESYALNGVKQPSSPTLWLTLLTDLCEPEFDTELETRLSLFTTILSTLKHIFMDARNVTLLKFCGPSAWGDFEAIDVRYWVDSLFRFPNLRHLIADDEELLEFPTTLVDALSLSGAFPGCAVQLICPELDTLALYGNIRGEAEGVAYLDRIIACLELRKERGGPTTLQHLKIGLYSTVAVSERFLAHYRRKLHRLAGNYSLEVHTDPLGERWR